MVNWLVVSPPIQLFQAILAPLRSAVGSNSSVTWSGFAGGAGGGSMGGDVGAGWVGAGSGTASSASCVSILRISFVISSISIRISGSVLMPLRACCSWSKYSEDSPADGEHAIMPVSLAHLKERPAMLDQLDLDRAIDKREYKERLRGLQARLYDMEQALFEARVP